MTLKRNLHAHVKNLPGFRQKAPRLTPQQRRDLKRKLKAAKEQCTCKVAKSTRVPHPRYGDKVAHFETSYVPDLNCPHRRAAGDFVMAAEGAMQPAVVDAPAQTPVQGTPDSGPVQCGATTKSGAQCRNKTLHGSGLCSSHREWL